MSVVDTAALRANIEAGGEYGQLTVLALLDELDTLRATVARIEALADHGDRVASQFPIHGGGHLPGIVGADDLRAALVSPTPDPTTP